MTVQLQMHLLINGKVMHFIVEKKSRRGPVNGEDLIKKKIKKVLVSKGKAKAKF